MRAAPRKRGSVRGGTVGMVSMLCLVVGIVSATMAADDSYIAGYAAAVLQHEFNVTGAVLQVHEGVVIVTADSLGKVDRAKVVTALESIPGVVRTEIREGAETSACSDGPAAGGYPARAPQARVKIPSSGSPRRSVPCRPTMAAFFRSIPSTLIRPGAQEYRLGQFW